VKEATGGRLKTVIVCLCEEAPPLRQTVTGYAPGVAKAWVITVPVPLSQTSLPSRSQVTTPGSLVDVKVIT
jgi:hypothetical protein